MDDPLIVAGTSNYFSFEVMRAAHEASGTNMITVAVRRVELSAKGKESLLSWIDTSRIAILPNTAACYTAADAVRTALLAREAGLSNWIKLEVIGDERTLYPDNETLVKEGFVLLPYTNDDPIVCRRKLKHAGAAGQLAYLAGRIPKKRYAAASGQTE